MSGCPTYADLLLATAQKWESPTANVDWPGLAGGAVEHDTIAGAMESKRNSVRIIGTLINVVSATATIGA